MMQRKSGKKDQRKIDLFISFPSSCHFIIFSVFLYLFHSVCDLSFSILFILFCSFFLYFFCFTHSLYIFLPFLLYFHQCLFCLFSSSLLFKLHVLNPLFLLPFFLPLFLTYLHPSLSFLVLHNFGIALQEA